MFLKPVPPPYDPLEWEKLPFPEKARQACLSWAMQGYGTPLAIYLVYALKIGLYVAGWLLCCAYTPGMGGLADIDIWWTRPEAFQKAILWSMLFELLGLGCGSGPLTGRYLPPVGGALYFLRPGTTKLPLFPTIPLLGGFRRGLLEVTLYATALVLLTITLLSAQIDPMHLLAIAVLVPVLGVLDRTLFLCARGEHYWTTLMVFVLAGSNFVAGAAWVHAALWFWAGISKLNHHFPAVVGVMTSNNPFLRSQRLRRWMYRAYPDDLTPSRLAGAMAHAGTALELGVPIILLAGDGGAVTLVGLVLMLLLHGFITSNIPMGVPLEWNVMMVYGGFYLFSAHAASDLSALSPATIALLLIMLIALPVIGNLWPARVPFLLAMRYYAGNWAYSVWLFRGDSYRKLGRLTKPAPWIYDQLAPFYDRRTCVGVVGKVMAFRLMHLHGRALPQLLPRAVDRLEDYEWCDGEIVAGLVLGWNFGDGHLHNEDLLRAVQAQCGFAAGELRCIMVESQPLARSRLDWRILDASTGLRERGSVSVAELRARAPWG